MPESLGLPAPILEYLVGDDQQKEGHARIKNEHAGIYHPAGKGVHVVELCHVGRHFPENRRRTVHDIVNKRDEEKSQSLGPGKSSRPRFGSKSWPRPGSPERR